MSDAPLPLPAPEVGLRGLFGRPTWSEWRVRRESRALTTDPIWDGEGVPPGRGRPIVLVPGFMAGTRSLSFLEPWLARCGWSTRRAPLGRNRAPGEVMVEDLEAWVDTVAAEEGGPVPLIGHSRGGQEARVLAVRRPEAISLLVTLGAPLRVLYPPALLVRAPVALLQLESWARRNRRDLTGHERYEADRVSAFPSEVPFVSVWSRTDGFIDWRACLDPAAEPAEVDCSHFGLTASVPAFRAIAAALGRLEPA